MNTLDEIDNAPNPENVSPMQTGLKYGIMLALAGVVIQLIMYIMGWGDPMEGDPTMSFLMGTASFAISIAIMVMAVRYHRDTELGGFISFGRAMLVYLYVGVASALITAIWGWLYNNVIAPETQEAMKQTIDQVRAQVEDGEAPEMALTIVESTFNMTNNPLMMFFTSLIGTLVIGLILSLILKRERRLR